MNKRILICAATFSQLIPVYDHMLKKKYSVDYILASQSGAKDTPANSLLIKMLRAVEFGFLSNSLFSMYHVGFIQNHSKNYFFNTLLKSLSYTSRKSRPSGKLIKRLLSRILKFQLNYFKTKNISSYDEIIFTGILTTKTELALFLNADNKNIKTTYWPANWDNASSKCINPLGSFTKSYYWTEEMKALMEIVPYYKILIPGAFPRLRYLQKVSHVADEVSLRILVALSQKSLDSSNKIISNLNSQIEKCGIKNVQITIRPHPASKIPDINNSKLNHIKLSTGDLIGINKSSNLTDAKNKMKIYEDEIVKVLSHADILICEGGTLILEAINIGIPSIILSINPYNPTAAHFNNFDHFKLLSSEESVKAVFSFHRLIENCQKLKQNKNQPISEDLKLIIDQN